MCLSFDTSPFFYLLTSFLNFLISLWLVTQKKTLILRLDNYQNTTYGT